MLSQIQIVGYGWADICTSGEVRLPCVLCLAEEQKLLCLAEDPNLESTAWKEVSMQHEQLFSHLDGRLRQHFKRVHNLLARDPKAEEMRQKAKELVCSLIHEQPDEQPPPAPEVRECRYMLNVRYT